MAKDQNTQASANGSDRLPVFSKLTTAFDNVPALAGTVKAYTAEDSAVPTDVQFIAVVKPTDVVVSRWYPGYREVTLSGKDADEALAIQLASTLTTAGALANFRTLLVTADLPMEIIAKLFPRAGVPIKRGAAYLVTDKTVRKTVASSLATRGFNQPDVVSAYSFIVTRVLAGLDLVQLSMTEKAILTMPAYAVNIDRLGSILLIDTLRGLFSEAHINTTMRVLSKDATPDIIGEAISRLFMSLSSTIHEIGYKLQQVEMVSSLVHFACVAPDALPPAMRGNADLARLAAMANFLVYASSKVVPVSPTGEIGEMREACKAVLTALQSAPSLEIIQLTKYASHFGVIPGAGTEGLNRGAVMYLALNQVSKMAIVDTQKAPDGLLAQAIPGSYAPITGLSSEINRTMLQPTAMYGVANIVADELGASEFQLGDAPLLLTLGVSVEDLQYVALAKAQSVAIVGGDSEGPELVFMATVAEQWRQRVLAATNGTAFFTSPASIIAYEVAAQSIEPTPLPSRPQSLNVGDSTETVYRGDVAQHFTPDVEQSFELRLPLRGMPGKPDTMLTLEINTLGPILSALTPDGKLVDRGDAHYQAILEPGVDRDLRLLLAVVSAYAADGGDILSDRAKSWLVETMGDVMKHPAVRGIAERALAQAIFNAKIDGRKLQAQYRELVIKAMFGSALAVLARFGKIDMDLAVKLVKVMPVSSLTVRAQLGLAAVSTIMRPLQPGA